MRQIRSKALVLAALFTVLSLGAAVARDNKAWIPVYPDGSTCDPDSGNCGGGDRDFRRDRNWKVFNPPAGCTEDRALRKAERMGIRRARITDVGRRTIDVRGRRDGNPVEVSFWRRDRSCPIAY